MVLVLERLWVCDRMIVSSMYTQRSLCAHVSGLPCAVRSAASWRVACKQSSSAEDERRAARGTRTAGVPAVYAYAGAPRPGPRGAEVRVDGDRRRPRPGPTARSADPG